MNDTDDLACVDFVEMVTNYLEDALPANERARVDRHLTVCVDCTEYLRQMRVTLAATGRLEAETLPVHVRGALLRGFRDWRER